LQFGRTRLGPDSRLAVVYLVGAPGVGWAGLGYCCPVSTDAPLGDAVRRGPVRVAIPVADLDSITALRVAGAEYLPSIYV